MIILKHAWFYLSIKLKESNSINQYYKNILHLSNQSLSLCDELIIHISQQRKKSEYLKMVISK
ncbi:MAG: hypothetical protein RSA09_14905, partial [Acinetobacter sp.]